MTISIAGTLILNGDIITNGEVSVEPSGLLIPIPRDLTDTIYSCPTKKFLCQNGKSPTITTSGSDINIRGLVDGIGQGFPANTGPGANSTLMDNQNDPSDIYGANHAGLGTVYNIPGTTELVEEYYTLHNLNIVQKGLDLNYKPINGTIALNIIHGPAQVYGVDFILQEDFISWADLALDGFLIAGDILRVIYEADTTRLFSNPKGVYGSYKAPTSIGSGSGEVSGGSGINLQAPIGTVNITGTINVSGENGSSNRTGGGSGGSVWVNSYNIDGGGNIVSEGGDASYSYAGGGGGGYVTLNYESENAFSGFISVDGHKGGTHGLVTIDKIRPIFSDKFTGTILNQKWWEIINEPVVLNNEVQMDTTTGDLRNPRMESLFELSGKTVKVDCDFLPTGVEPSYHTSYFRLFIDDRNWVQVARKHNNIFGMYSVDGFLSQTALPYPYTDTIFRIYKNDSTFTFQYLDSTGPQTIVSDVIPEFENQIFKVALGTNKDEADSSNYVTDYFKLTNVDEAFGYVTLSSIPVDASFVTLNVVGGSAQIYGVDYSVSGQNLFWNPSLNLLEDDEIVVQYMEDGTFNNLQVAWDNFKVYNGIIRGIETTRPTVYVDPIYGSDTSDGGITTPLQNLFVATAWAKRGGTVILYSGNYSPSEIENKNITIQGAYGSSAIISSANALDTTGSNWENSGLTFRNCRGDVQNITFNQSREGVYADEVNNFEISNCNISDVTTAIKFVKYSKDCRVLRNTLHDASVGVDFGNQNYNLEINSNVIYDTSTALSLVDASNYIVSSNTIDNNDVCLIVDGSSQGVVYSNNLTNSVVGINAVAPDSTVEASYNNFYSTATSTTGLGSITGSSNITGNPGYFNQILKNYHLLSFSADRSNGSSVYDQYMLDRDGVDRTAEPSYDIGAYRYLNVSHPTGTAYYVDGSGNDYLNNGTESYPYRTLDKAMSLADSSVIISKGAYDSFYLALKNQTIQIDSSAAVVTETLKITLHGQYSDLNISRAVYVSPSGSDSTVMGGDGTNSGGNGTVEKPYRTISWALSQSSAGDYLVVMPGEYPLFVGSDNRVIVPYNDHTGTPDGRMYVEDLFNTPYTAYPNHVIDYNNLWVLDTTAPSEIEMSEGYLSMSFDGTHSVNATSAFEFSPYWSDNTSFEVYAELRQAFDPIFFNVYDNSSVFTFRINDGDYTCSYFDSSCWGHLSNIDLEDTFFTDYVCITSSEIENKCANLTYLIQSESEVAANIIGGPPQELGTDFYVENNQIKWDGMTLDGQIKAGDLLRVIYIPKNLSSPIRVKFVLKDNTMTMLGMINGHYEMFMKRLINIPISDAWKVSFVMDTVEHSSETTGRGYVSKLLVIAGSFENTGLAQPYQHKIWRQPVIVYKE